MWPARLRPVLGQFDGPLDPAGHEREGRSALPLQDLPAAMGHHERRRPERRRITPRDLAAVEHAPAHDVGAGRGERLLDDLRVDRPLAAGVAQPFPPPHGVDDPAGNPEETGPFGARHEGRHVVRVGAGSGPGVVTVERNRHLRGDLGHRCSSWLGGHDGRRYPLVGAARRASTRGRGIFLMANSPCSRATAPGTSAPPTSPSPGCPG